MKPVFSLLLFSLVLGSLSSCGWMMNQPEEQTRVPVPPSGTTKSQLPWNTKPKFEADAQLGPLANPRR